MDWSTVVASLVGSAIGGPAAVLGLSKYIGDRWLEEVKARHSKELAEMQNAFSMGSNSHMATVAFDKYVEFCEEYVEATANALIHEGKRDKPPDRRDFFRIRQKWALWLNHEIEIELDRFEHDIARIGSDAQVLDANGAPVSNDRSQETVIGYLRKVLATEELNALRSELVARCIKKSSTLSR